MPNLIDSLMKAGKFGNSKPNPGWPWTNAELASLIGVSETTVSKWRNDRKKPREENARSLLDIFFKSNERSTIQYADLFRFLISNDGGSDQLKEDSNTNQSLTGYHKKPSANLFWEHFISQLAKRFTFDRDQFLKFDLAATTASEAARLSSNLIGAEDRTGISEAAEESRRYVFDMKYQKPLSFFDEREKLQVGTRSWIQEFEALFASTGMNLNSDCICVGIGNRGEATDFYRSFRTFSAYDISSKVVAYVSSETKLAIKQSSAESLPVPRDSFDVYFSLRTYNSSFFDMRRAAHEACRVLRPGGRAIISIPRGYMYDDGEVIYGLSRTNYSVLSSLRSGGYGPPEKEYVVELVAKVANCLAANGFEDIRFQSGAAEHYIIGRRARSLKVGVLTRNV